MRVLSFIKIILVFTVLSCVQAPEPDTNASGSISDSDIGHSLLPSTSNAKKIILSEGLWGLNNSDLTILSADNSVISKSLIAESASKYLGDTASDIVYKDGKLYIAVTISNKIIELDLVKNRISDILLLPEEFRAPRAIAFNNNKLFVTDQFEDKVIIIDISNDNMQVVGSFQVGPAPEDIIIENDIIYIANSGYGDFRANEPKAGYITTYSSNGNLLDEKFIGENVVNLIKFEDKIIAGYLNTPENLQNGEKGGIKILKADNLSVLDSIEIDYQRMTINKDDGILYVLTNSGVSEVILEDGLKSAIEIIPNPSNDIWYEIEYDFISNSLYISNAKNHQIEGEVLIYSLSTNLLLQSILTGINPSDIIFLEN